MNRMITGCPVCRGALHVREMGCESCGTRVCGEFDASPFARLSTEQSEFVGLFLRSRGNISGLGAELGISYPTAVKRLDAILAVLALGGADPAGGRDAAYQESPPEPDPRDTERERILDLLDRGEVTAEEATRRIQELWAAPGQPG